MAEAPYIKHWKALDINANELLDAVRSAPVTSIRLQPLKVKNKSLDQRVPWASDAYYLSERPSFTLDPVFQAGGYYVQEAGSMLLEQAFIQHNEAENPVVIDLCASPGGKSTHLASLIGYNGVLMSNEISSQRFKVLTQNLDKWGQTNVIRTKANPAQIGQLTHLADVLVIDAPCSGEGLFRRMPQHQQDWNDGLMDQCAARQVDIVKESWGALKPGGLLIYSTCTWNTKENEAIADYITSELGGESLSLSLEPSWGVKRYETNQIHTYRCFSHLMKSEGFVLTVIRKGKSDCQPHRPTKVRQTTCPDWLPKPPQDHIFVEMFDQVFLCHARNEAVFSALQSQRIYTTPGVTCGQRKGKLLKPVANLAWVVGSQHWGLPLLEHDLSQAIDYHRRKPLMHRADGKFILGTYRGLPIGLYSNAGNRLNNLLDKSLAIQTTQEPEAGLVADRLEMAPTAPV